MGFIKWYKLMNEDYKRRKAEEPQKRMERLQQVKQSGAMYCPVCLSTNITTIKKGYSAKKGITGAVLFGGVGLVGGAIGSNNVKVVCLDCGNVLKTIK